MVGICILHLTLLIDALSKFPFLRGEASIDLAGFKVVREALSATYGILFTLFVATAFLESKLLKTSISAADGAASKELPALDLWFLSPFSDTPLFRKLFWFLFIDGFLFLAQFSFVHLALIWPPAPARMSPAIYRTIGAIDLLLFAICTPFAYWTYQNLQQVRSILYEDDKVA